MRNLTVAQEGMVTATRNDTCIDHPQLNYKAAAAVFKNWYIGWCEIFLIRILFSFIANSELQVRLNGSSNNMSGRVEIYHPTLGWGTVCDDEWDMKDGQVVCRQLGFVGASKTRNEGYYGEGSGPILLDDVQCSGNETFIWECDHYGWNQHDCSHREDASVQCY